jgi:hypothetical protein
MTTTKKNLNKEIIALFSGQSRMLTLPKLYVQLTKNHSLALVLNQCVFFSDKSSIGDGWFYKTYEEWFEEIHIPERTLRRRFEKLAGCSWIETKIKAVDGLNILHVRPNMDKIIESIEDLLNKKCPNRPHCPDGAESEPNSCTKLAPTGQLDRARPANLSGSSIYTDDKTHMSVGQSPPPTPFFEEYKTKELEGLNNACEESRKEKFEREALQDDHNIFLFNQKFSGYDVKIEDLFKACQEHYEQKGLWVGSQRFNSWIKNERIDKHSKKDSPRETNNKPMSMFTPEELELLASYKQAIRLNVVDKFFTTEQKLQRAREVYERERTLIENNTRMQINAV